MDEAKRNIDRQTQQEGNGHLKVVQPQPASPTRVSEDKPDARTLIEDVKNDAQRGVKPETAEEEKKRNENENKMADDAIKNLFK